MKHINRIAFYIGGLFLTAIGVVLAIKSDLGVSPVSSVPLSLSNITGLSLGLVSTMVFSFYLFLQFSILPSEFKLKNLLQLSFSVIFGVFVGFAEMAFKDVIPRSYMMQLTFVLLSVCIIALGILLMITMDIVPSASEGLILAFCKRTGMEFFKMKTLFDTGSVVLAICLSLLFAQNMSFIREGTIISALLIGRAMGILSKSFKPWLRSMAFYSPTT